jgi:large subunit ribosomal protein L3
MPTAILGTKIGMTRIFDEAGNDVPVTIIKVGPCFVTQIKTEAVDGYDAVQMGFEEIKPRNSTFPVIGHDAAAGIAPQRFHREVLLEEDEIGSFELGQEINAESMSEIQFVDVVGTSKGKGFQGVVKRHGFKGKEATHGVERKHRSPGSICGRSSNRGTGKPKKGIRMGGHMGDERVTVRSLAVVGIDKERGLLLIKGPVPGCKTGLVMVSEAKRLYKGKAQLAKAG